MSFLVIQMGLYSSNAFTYYEIENLDQLKGISNAVTIDAVYEIVRKVPIQTKYEEETVIVKQKPYLDIDGVKIPISTSSGTLTINGTNCIATVISDSSNATITNPDNSFVTLT